MNKLAKILRGSQNYGLDIETSDKDYYYVVMPEVKDLMNFKETSGKIVEEEQDYWDVRKFFKKIIQGNFNALELLFSVEVIFYNDDFKKIYYFLKDNASIIVESNKENLYKSCLGIFNSRFNNFLKEKNSKFAVNCLYINCFLIFLRVKEYKISEEIFRNEYSKYLKDLRKMNFLFEESILLNVKEQINSEKWYWINNTSNTSNNLKTLNDFCEKWFIDFIKNNY